VVLGDYREFLVAIAGAAGSLTGLLFVALSVAPRHPLNPGPTVIQQVRATAALLSFSNALAVSLFGLVPGNNVGYPAVVLGVIGILFTAAGARSIHSSAATLHQRRHQLGLITLLVLIFGVEFGCGVILIADPGGRGNWSVTGAPTSLPRSRYSPATGPARQMICARLSRPARALSPHRRGRKGVGRPGG
jgi:hypothetical protein